MPIRIFALVTDAFGGWGGIAQYNRDFLAAVCASARVERVVCLPRLAAAAPERLPAKLVFDRRAAGGAAAYLGALLRHARGAGGFDLIYCGHIHLLAPALALGRATRAPVALQIHGIDAWTPPRKWLAARLAGRPGAVLSTSRLTLERFLGWSRMPAARGCVIPCTYDARAFRPGPKPAQLVERYGLAGRRVLLTLGRLVSEERAKGFDVVLDALPGLARQAPDLAYVIAGAGPDRARLEAKARRLGLGSRVVFAGKVAEAEKADHYRLADAYVMPSRGEGFGITLLEAMACGVPALGSTRDGTAEALRQGELGLLVDPLDAGDVAQGVLRALGRERRVPPGLDHFSQARFAERVEAFLDRVVRL